MNRRRQTIAVMLALTGVLAVACGPVAPPTDTTPTSTSSTVSTTTTPTTSTTSVPVPEPASVQVVPSQLSPGPDTTIISGQSAPLEYQLTVTNSGDEPSGPVIVTDTVEWPTSLIAGSVSCGASPDCEVTADGDTATWLLGDIGPRTTHTLSFSAKVRSDFGSATTTITNSASFTNVATPGCSTVTCRTEPVINDAEEFEFQHGATQPGNVVFFSGLNWFEPFGWATNDPAAEIFYEWSCVPDYLCYVADRIGDRVQFNLIYDEFENTNLLMMLKVTAVQGDRVVEFQTNNWFRVLESTDWGGL